ncbi:hypothetical protein Hypma_001923 [Hypsizygus marmoreus]|uniref:Uncharacterized protein n=1 Tax=Hypsizygus marmoreus TaxID=39966 RepID=A0A369J9H3_HYPMA|nr:hypothetical protein Hypma_001923 [Hypsizygus marmoreus]
MGGIAGYTADVRVVAASETLPATHFFRHHQCHPTRPIHIHPTNTSHRVQNTSTPTDTATDAATPDPSVSATPSLLLTCIPTVRLITTRGHPTLPYLAQTPRRLLIVVYPSILPTAHPAILCSHSTDQTCHPPMTDSLHDYSRLHGAWFTPRRPSRPSL